MHSPSYFNANLAAVADLKNSFSLGTVAKRTGMSRPHTSEYRRAVRAGQRLQPPPIAVIVLH
jgi:hypothetical protein